MKNIEEKAINLLSQVKNTTKIITDIDYDLSKELSYERFENKPLAKKLFDQFQQDTSFDDQHYYMADVFPIYNKVFDNAEDFIEHYKNCLQTENPTQAISMIHASFNNDVDPITIIKGINLKEVTENAIENFHLEFKSDSMISKASKDFALKLYNEMLLEPNLSKNKEDLLKNNIDDINNIKLKNNLTEGIKGLLKLKNK